MSAVQTPKTKSDIFTRPQPTAKPKTLCGLPHIEQSNNFYWFMTKTCLATLASKAKLNVIVGISSILTTKYINGPKARNVNQENYVFS